MDERITNLCDIARSIGRIETYKAQGTYTKTDGIVEGGLRKSLHEKSHELDAELAIFDARTKAMTEAREALQKVVKAWESLPGGQYYTASEIEQWLRGPMKRSINKARKTLKGMV